MDDKKRKGTPEGRNIIDLDAAREEKRRAERAEEKRMARSARPSLRRRMLSLFLVLVLVLGAVLVTVYWDDINFDALRRTISYIGTTQDESGGTDPFFYDRGSASAFAVLGNHLICATNKETTIYDFAGNELYQADVKLESLVLCVGGSLAAVYEVGGSHLTVFNEQGQKLNLILENGLGIYAASLNEADYLAVTSQKKNQKGCVTVYNANMEKIFSFDSSTRFVVNAYVTEDCKYMVAETLGQESGTFVSEMVVYRLDREEQYAAFSVENAMVLDIGSVGGQTVCIAEDRVVVATSGGQISASYPYALPYLREYSLDGDGFAVLALNRHRAGTSGKLVTVNSSGEAIAELDLNDEILDLTAAGRYIAVLYADRLTVYNKDLTEYATFTQTETAQFACMRSDGSVWLITADTISLLIP